MFLPHWKEPLSQWRTASSIWPLYATHEHNVQTTSHTTYHCIDASETGYDVPWPPWQRPISFRVVLGATTTWYDKQVAEGMPAAEHKLGTFRGYLTMQFELCRIGKWPWMNNKKVLELPTTTLWALQSMNLDLCFTVLNHIDNREISLGRGSALRNPLPTQDNTNTERPQCLIGHKLFMLQNARSLWSARNCLLCGSIPAFASRD
jgi:hypothetical protein